MGRYLEDFTVGDVYRSQLGRTITDTDNSWFTLLTHNTNQLHFNQHFAEQSTWQKMLVNSGLTLCIVSGLSVADVSENAMANLGWGDIVLSTPVFAGDTLWSESEVLSVRESKSRPDVGVVGVRTRGINQRGEVVVEFRRTMMIYKRGSGPAFEGPAAVSDWTID